jgi:hypothetical protein
MVFLLTGAIGILPLLAARGTAGRDDPDDGVGIAVAMHHDHHAHLGAHAHQHEAALVLRVVRVRDEQAVLVGERRRRLLERDAVLAPVRRRLGRIPLELDPRHMHSVCT